MYGHRHGRPERHEPFGLVTMWVPRGQFRHRGLEGRGVRMRQPRRACPGSLTALVC
jgi:hypothetical protein